MEKKIVLTGGGTAGHVTPNIALLPELRNAGFEVSYMGSYDGIEKRLMEDYDVPYYGVATGKLRRYFDLKNFTDPFKIIKGYYEAKAHLKEINPSIVFSKGGFVSVPIVRAAHALHIPCIIHESDITPGLANKLCIPLAEKVCCNFPETVSYLPTGKSVLTGSPIRRELSEGKREKGLSLCGFNSGKPVVLIIGGSLGARNINLTVRNALSQILKDFNIVHICGKGNLDDSLNGIVGYKQFEYLKEDLKDVFAMADVVISRAGANSICELLALKKPNLLIPLPASASRGDQLLNAASFESQGFSLVLHEEDMTPDTLVQSLQELFCNRQSYIDNMTQSSQLNPIATIMGLIEEYRLK